MRGQGPQCFLYILLLTLWNAQFSSCAFLYVNLTSENNLQKTLQANGSLNSSFDYHFVPHKKVASTKLLLSENSLKSNKNALLSSENTLKSSLNSPANKSNQELSWSKIWSHLFGGSSKPSPKPQPPTKMEPVHTVIPEVPKATQVKQPELINQNTKVQQQPVVQQPVVQQQRPTVAQQQHQTIVHQPQHTTISVQHPIIQQPGQNPQKTAEKPIGPADRNTLDQPTNQKTPTLGQHSSMKVPEVETKPKTTYEPGTVEPSSPAKNPLTQRSDTPTPSQNLPDTSNDKIPVSSSKSSIGSLAGGAAGAAVIGGALGQGSGSTPGSNGNLPNPGGVKKDPTDNGSGAGSGSLSGYDNPYGFSSEESAKLNLFIEQGNIVLGVIGVVQGVVGVVNNMITTSYLTYTSTYTFTGSQASSILSASDIVVTSIQYETVPATNATSSIQSSLGPATELVISSTTLAPAVLTPSNTGTNNTISAPQTVTATAYITRLSQQASMTSSI